MCKSVIRRWLICLFVLATLSACDLSAGHDNEPMETSGLFAGLDLVGLDPLLQTEDARKTGFQDLQVRAYGRFDPARRGDIQSILLSHGFEAADDRSFIGGDNWPVIEQPVVESGFFLLGLMKKDVQFQMLTTADGRGFFRYELVGY